ncbi:MAG: TetR/AcrR family transcriptional regulator [Streptomyces sp.]|nr:TetR/AcrR family transcriptional regulator [Streptomyces sp.]
MAETANARPGTRGPVRTRRRGDDLRNAILDAALRELAATGYGRLTMEGVAAAAGTGKAALYRRWPNKDELVTDALRTVLPDLSELRLDGPLRDDLLALLLGMRDAMNIGNGAVFQTVKQEGGEGAFGKVFAMMQQRVLYACRDAVLGVLRRGAAAGEVCPSAVNTALATAGPAMLIHFAVTEECEVPDDYVVSIVDDVLMPAAVR